MHCRLVQRFEALLHIAVTTDAPLRVAVVGGGAGGVELACALKHRWEGCQGW
jgi:selenide,water dikinase